MDLTEMEDAYRTHAKKILRGQQADKEDAVILFLILVDLNVLHNGEHRKKIKPQEIRLQLQKLKATIQTRSRMTIWFSFQNGRLILWSRKGSDETAHEISAMNPKQIRECGAADMCRHHLLSQLRGKLRSNSPMAEASGLANLWRNLYS